MLSRVVEGTGVWSAVISSSSSSTAPSRCDCALSVDLALENRKRSSASSTTALMAPTSYTLLLDPINAVLPPSPAAQPLARRAPGRSGAYGASAPNFLNSGRQKFALTENVPHEVVQQYRRGLVHTDSHTLGRRASLGELDGTCVLDARAVLSKARPCRADGACCVQQNPLIRRRSHWE